MIFTVIPIYIQLHTIAKVVGNSNKSLTVSRGFVTKHKAPLGGVVVPPRASPALLPFFSACGRGKREERGARKTSQKNISPLSLCCRWQHSPSHPSVFLNGEIATLHFSRVGAPSTFQHCLKFLMAALKSEYSPTCKKM